MVIRSMVCGRPPGSAGRAPQACRHSMTPDGTVDDGSVSAGVTAGVTAGVGPGVGAADDSLVQPATTVARPAPPATARSRRRVSPSRSPAVGFFGLSTADTIEAASRKAESALMVMPALFGWFWADPLAALVCLF